MGRVGTTASMTRNCGYTDRIRSGSAGRKFLSSVVPGTSISLFASSALRESKHGSSPLVKGKRISCRRSRG